MNKKRLMILASSGRPFREYHFAAMSAVADLILVDTRELTWQKPYLGGHRHADPHDRAAVSRIVAEERPDGLVTYDDALVETVAEVAREHGLPHTDPAAVRLCKDKAALRARLTDAGLGPVRFAVVQTEEEALSAAADIGWPVVLKPRDLGGSVGVVRVDDAAQLREHYNTAAGLRDRYGDPSGPAGLLVEEYLDGPEFSVDSLTWQGKTRPLFVAEKRLGPAPYFEEVGHVVPASPRPEFDEALDLVVAAHKAARLDNLVTHTEFRLTGKGPRIIEINVRLGGDLIPHLGLLATGIDLSAATAQVALGEVPDLTPDRSVTAAVTMLYPPHDMTFRRLRPTVDTAELVGLRLLGPTVPPGSELRLPPAGFRSRAGFAVVTGDSRAECLARLDAVAASVVIEGEALPTPV
ncbi:ATP-grasp domain-containing protein [Streptomyces sp. NRRL S-31]|uniref:ATP-grasp domain-containing protein n=1 Tax=Streptomyces sp. NRRL S-31 TaxID=1463898 RepID=UPI0004C8A49D|nr:ATP-grasp domain-containing protein [Streptomyces sp. NRRL S-31]